MAGETEIRRVVADPGIEVLHLVAAVAGKGQAVAGEAEAFKRPGKDIKGACVRRGHAGAANQGLA